MSGFWSPPENPAPSKILHEAANDIGERRFEIALDKFLWFHKHALDFDRHLGPVRLSFAIGYWHLLAMRYPPAMDALQAARDEAERVLLESGYKHEYFQEFAAICRELRESKRVVDLFKEAAQVDREAAQGIYHIAEKFLVKEGDYGTCAPFLDPRRIEELLVHYGLGRGRCDPELEAEKEQMRKRYFTERVGTLVALLVLNNRTADAEAVYSHAIQTLDDVQFRTVLDAAMTDHFPAPWYP